MGMPNTGDINENERDWCLVLHGGCLVNGNLLPCFISSFIPNQARHLAGLHQQRLGDAMIRCT